MTTITSFNNVTVFNNNQADLARTGQKSSYFSSKVDSAEQSPVLLNKQGNSFRGPVASAVKNNNATARFTMTASYKFYIDFLNSFSKVPQNSTANGA